MVNHDCFNYQRGSFDPLSMFPPPKWANGGLFNWLSVTTGVVWICQKDLLVRFAPVSWALVVYQRYSTFRWSKSCLLLPSDPHFTHFSIHKFVSENPPKNGVAELRKRHLHQASMWPCVAWFEPQSRHAQKQPRTSSNTAAPWQIMSPWWFIVKLQHLHTLHQTMCTFGSNMPSTACRMPFTWCLLRTLLKCCRFVTCAIDLIVVVFWAAYCSCPQSCVDILHTFDKYGSLSSKCAWQGHVEGSDCFASCLATLSMTQPPPQRNDREWFQHVANHRTPCTLTCLKTMHAYLLAGLHGAKL